MNNFYGDNQRWFVATVISTDDPAERGRVKIRIHGIHSSSGIDVPEYALPWAEVMLPSTEGGTSGIGRIPRIMSSAFVFGVFLDGPTSQAPLVLGSMTHKKGPSVAYRQAVGRGEFVSKDAFSSNGTIVPDDIKSQYISPTNLEQNRLIAMQFFVRNGFAPEVAAAIVGNFQAESNINPGIPSAVPGENSYGIAQWNAAAAAGNRLGKLKKFANNEGKDYTDLFTQLEYTIHELRGKQLNNDGGGDFSHVYSQLRRCTTFEGGVDDLNATWVFLSEYEIPAQMRSKLNTREQYARIAFEQFSSAVAVESVGTVV